MDLFRWRLLFFFWVASCLSFAQNNFRFYKLGLENGLSQSVVTSIIQDRYGFLWFGTQYGLNRYDGYKIVNYFHNPRDSNSLTDNKITSLFEDSEGLLWIGTLNGLNCYNPVKNRFVRYKYSFFNSNSLSDNQVVGIAADSSNNLWILTKRGLNMISRDRAIITRYYFPPEWGKSFAGANTLFLDRSNTIWIGSDNAFLVKFDVKNKKFTRFSYPDNSSSSVSVNDINQLENGWLILSTEDGIRYFNTQTCLFEKRILRQTRHNYIFSKPISKLLKEKQNVFWFGIHTRNGQYELARFDFLRGTLKTFRGDDLDPFAFSNERICSMYLDRFGVIWVGTFGKCINYFNPYQLKFNLITKNLTRPKWLYDDFVFSFYEQSDGNLWVGTSGGAFYFYNQKKNEFEKFTENFADDNRITAIVPAGKFKIWIGNGSKVNGRLTLLDLKTKKRTPFPVGAPNGKNLNEKRIKCLLSDTLNHKLYVGTFGGGVNIVNTLNQTVEYLTHKEGDTNSLANNDVNDILMDSFGNLWISTSEGLSYYNTKTKQFKNFKYDPRDSGSISNNYVLSVCEDAKKRIWVCTAHGFNLFNENNGTFTTFTRNDGLADNYIYGCLEDSQGNLWISTNNGLTRFNYDEKTVRNFDVADGLQSKEFNTHAFHKGLSGKFYFGGINGFNSFYPHEIVDNLQQPKILLTNFRLLGKDYKLDTAITFKKKLVLNYDQNYIGFEFTSVDFLNPTKNRYAIKLEGLNNDWINLENENFATFTNLDPGKYKLRIKATNNDGVWNEEGIALNIEILPPFWKTWWFYTLVVSFFLSLLLLYVKWREKRIKQEKRELELKVRERTLELIQERDKIILLNKELVEQRIQVEEQKALVERKNKHILESIEYAQRIQKALLPSKEFFIENFEDSFVLFMPKDIVSGDFYWASQHNNNTVYLLTGDCTGHGVPGAFMSLLNITYVNEALVEKDLDDPAQILDFVRTQLIKNLYNANNITKTVDGMDCAFWKLNKNTLQLTFATANNPVWLVREFAPGEEHNGPNGFTVLQKYLNHNAGYYILYESQIDKMPVGQQTQELKSFNTYSCQLKKGDCIYTFTDGIVDQIGGPRGKKFKYKQLEEMIIENAHLDMQKQRNIFEERINKWMGNHQQLDDMLLIGIRV